MKRKVGENADSKERGVTSSLEREVGDDSLQRLASSSCHVKRLPGTKATRKFVPLVQCHGHATCVASTPTKLPVVSYVGLDASKHLHCSKSSTTNVRCNSIPKHV
ncbi:hypothetical protein V1478_011977, partial [Vespula squamosa]